MSMLLNITITQLNMATIDCSIATYVHYSKHRPQGILYIALPACMLKLK